ncbi:TIR domain-containing protein [Actinoplanes sp. NPDC026670]|uniref:TIR domain-containing protein n=1 Tax=Actinoplanes sp. NPDC026670 TaxID=3154700 RepID=UPI0033C48C54
MPFDGFISYSHAADGRLAPAVQRGLHRLAKPWHRRRALWIFRDQTGLSVTPKLWTSIQDALDGSKHFVLLASPEAAASPWVNREIEHWLATKSPDRILPVVTDGEWGWDPATRDFTAESTAVPHALRGVFAEEPLYLDLRWARDDLHLSLQHVRFRDAIAQLAAPMHGVSKDELEGEDVRQHRRARRLSVVAVTALVVLTLVTSLTGFVAVRNAERATLAANEARLQEELASQQRGTAERATAESQRQQANALAQEENAREQLENAREQEARAQAARAETKRQEELARQQQALAEEASAEARREQANAERFKASAATQQANAQRQKANAEQQQKLAGEAAAEAARQKTNAEREQANAKHQQELADQATARAKEQEKIAEHHRELARLAEEERKRQEQLAREASEEARRQREAAELQQRTVINQRLLARARGMITDDPRKALRLAVAAQNLLDDTATREQVSHLTMASTYSGYLSDVIDVEALTGQAAATTGAGGTVSLWDTTAPAKPVRVASLPAGGTADKSLAVSRDGRTLVVFDGSAEATRWDVTKPADPVRLTPLTDDAGITAVNFSPDGKTVAASNRDKNTVLWDVTGTAPARLSTLAGVYPLKFGPDGRTGVTSGADVVAWDLSDLTAPVRHAILDPGWGTKVPDAAIEYNPTLPIVAMQGPSDYVYLFGMADLDDPQPWDSRSAGPGDTNFSTMVFTPTGDMLAIGCSDGTSVVVSIDYNDNWPSMNTEITSLTARGTPVRSMAYSQDGMTLLTAGDRNIATLWSPKGRYARGPATTIRGPFPAQLAGLAYRPDGSLTAARRDSVALTYDLTVPSAPVAGPTVPLQSGNLVGMMATADGKTMYVIGTDNVTTLLDVSRTDQAAVVSRISEAGTAVWVATISPDGRTLVVGRSDGRTAVYDVSDRTKPAKLAGLTFGNRTLSSMTFSPDSRTLAVADGYNISMWDMTDRSAPARVASIPVSDYSSTMATSIEFSPNGRILAAGTNDNGTTILYDVADPAQPHRVGTLPANSSFILWASFAPDGRTLATAALDNSIMLWDVTDPGTPIRYAVLKNSDLQNVYMVFSPDGRSLAAGGSLGIVPSRTITFWDIAVSAEVAADPVAHACTITGRGLTADEWALYIPELPYRSTC